MKLCNVCALVFQMNSCINSTMSLSTGTLNLKFMQRGNQPNAGPSATKPTNRKVDPAHWVLPSASASVNANAKGKGKAAIQDVEFEGSYLPFLDDEDENEGSTGGGRRMFGLAVVCLDLAGLHGLCLRLRNQLLLLCLLPSQLKSLTPLCQPQAKMNQQYRRHHRRRS